ncbi:MAG: hypothetical protein AB202_03000 [Parcubacteria bacterium C7867-007]|nr:MAG: hypothetical protein AB202_03000 [Parcubacteria bacterium C7867-007]
MADDPAASISNTPSDPTPYIRTYAKDVARLTGKQPIAVHSTVKKDAPEPGVLLPDFDPTQSLNSSRPSSPREFPQEVISVTADDTVANLNAPGPDLSNREVRRDEILTRLRAKVGRDEPAVELPHPTPPAPVAPVKPVPVYVPPPQPAPVPPPAPVVVPEPPHKAHKQAFTFFGHHGTKKESLDPAPTNLHTFKSDFADHIDSQKATTFSVLAAQSDSKENLARTPKPASTTSKKPNLPFILGGVTLLVLGIGIVGGSYWFVSVRTPSSGLPFIVPSLIFADEKVEITGDSGPELMQALAAVAQGPSVNGNIIVTYITEREEGVVSIPQAGGQLIKQLFQNAPDILLRNITDGSTVGVIDAGDSNAPFFILDVSSYERTFAGMLGWEPTIAANLAPLYPPHLENVSTSTGARIVNPTRFMDKSVANHDVRVLIDSNNKTILIYGYRDKQTLIIARDEAAFSAILVRLAAGNTN